MSAADLDHGALAVLAGRWLLDPEASTARFSVRNWGVHRVQGTVPLIAGAVKVDSSGTVVSAWGEADPAEWPRASPAAMRTCASPARSP